MTAAKRAASWWGARLQSGSQEQRQAFEKALEHEVSNEIANIGEFGVHLGVDYDASDLIANALDKADIGPGRHFMFSARGVLPMKTQMIIRGDRITVSEGYGAPWVDV